MKIYIDLVLFLNFILDFLLLISVSIILKRITNIIRIILASLIGSISILSLFINMSSFELFIFKVIISIFMILISFGYKNIKDMFTNISYLYLLSIILGGALYLINDSFSYKNTGIIFFHNGFSINIILIIILSPIILILYIKKVKEQKEELSKYYKCSITFLNNKTVNITGFLDTGNNLYDPYKKRPIIVINKDILDNYKPRYILVPCITVNKKSMLKCFKVKKIVINNKVIEDEFLVGISDNNFNMGEVDLLLHKKIIKER